MSESSARELLLPEPARPAPPEDVVPASADGPRSRVFGPQLGACATARAYVERLLTVWGLTHLRDEAVLAVSELIANVLVHTDSLAGLTLRRTGRDGLWIGVHDTSHRRPVVGRAAATAGGGRGLHIIDVLADTWGVTPDAHSSGKTVWLQLTTHR